jgi:hypothetical protein
MTVRNIMSVGNATLVVANVLTCNKHSHNVAWASYCAWEAGCSYTKCNFACTGCHTPKLQRCHQMASYSPTAVHHIALCQHDTQVTSCH